MSVEENISKVSFAQQPIWNINLLKYDYETIRFTNWISNEILNVNDFLKTTHNL